jgi:type I restriction enzyme S subunit
MSEWQKVKVGDLLKRSKITIDIEDSEIYSRVTIRGKHKGISLRDEEIGKKIGTKKQFVLKAGQFLMSKIDARYGAFGIAGTDVDDAIITGNFWAYDINKKLTTVEWINNYTNSPAFYDLCERASSGITHRKYLDEKAFLNHELFIPVVEKQHEILDSLNKRKECANNVTHEINTQQTYLTQLRQAILQEAIEGKLTADWRVKNPVQKGNPDHDAQALLETIKAEKQKLIADGKLKKEKPLAPINPDDVPFALPDGWVWVRLGEVAEELSTGPFGSTLHKSDYIPNGIPLINPTNIVNGSITANENVTISETTKSRLEKYVLKTGDFVIARRGDLSKCGIVQEHQNGWICGTGSFFMRILSINKIFFQRAYTSTSSQKYLLKDSIGQTMDNLNQSLLSKLPLALPPLAEQNAIVERVDRLLESVNALELQVQERKSYAQQLMQAVLKEAFAG